MADPEAAPAETRLEEVLTDGGWRLEVRLGRVAVESRTLTFCAGGRVRERIMDDTGVHDLYGKWNLERSPGGHVLTLSGEGLRDRGRFEARYSEGEKAIYLRIEPGDRTLRFKSVRGGSPSPCAAPVALRF